MSENALWDVWYDRDPLKIPNTDLTLRGFSIAALRTNFYIKELGVMLDGGLSSNFLPDHIFITHTHTDHIANLTFHLFDVKHNIGPENKVNIYVPQEMCSNIERMIQGVLQVNSSKVVDSSKYCYKLHPVSPSTILELTIKNRKFKIEIIKCYHGIPCVGFGFIEIKSKLKEQYRILTSKEISELKKQGIEITEQVELPSLCFLGDTSKEILNDKTIEKYKTIMIECTFIYDDHIDEADEKKHMHWSSLKPYVESHPNNTFILYHFSRRYKKTDISTFFDKYMTENKVTNIIPWIN